MILRDPAVHDRLWVNDRNRRKAELIEECAERGIPAPKSATNDELRGLIEKDVENKEELARLAAQTSPVKKSKETHVPKKHTTISPDAGKKSAVVGDDSATDDGSHVHIHVHSDPNALPVTPPPAVKLKKGKKGGVPKMKTVRASSFENANGWSWLGAILAVIVLLIIGWAIYNHFSDDKSSSSSHSASSATANLFGGKANDWSEVPGSGSAGWIYSGPATELNVPAGYRIDYSGHTCDNGSNSGVYGPTKVAVSTATIWNVPGETHCAATSQKQTAQSVDPTTVPENSSKEAQAAAPNTRANCASAVVNAEGYPGPTTAEAKTAITVDVQRLGTECSAFVFRIPQEQGKSPQTVSTKCSQGYVCTLTLPEGTVKVFTGDNQSRDASSGTFRWIDGYPASDKVHENPPCKLAASEDRFGKNEDPSFSAAAGNFSCAGTSTTSLPPAVATTATASCPTSPEDAATRVGGSASSWTSIPGNGWKYGPNAPAVNLTAPVGAIDSAAGRSKTASGVTEATLWCDA